jgi:hypothetical protein
MILTSLALLVVFVFSPGGFETQGDWFLALLPAAIAVYPFLDFVHQVAPRAETSLFWISMAIMNFLWYWLICRAVIKIRRWYLET